jgi:hypothetical protein
VSSLCIEWPVWNVWTLRPEEGKSERLYLDVNEAYDGKHIPGMIVFISCRLLHAGSRDATAKYTRPSLARSEFAIVAQRACPFSSAKTNLRANHCAVGLISDLMDRSSVRHTVTNVIL